jgi:hypothetical protein
MVGIVFVVTETDQRSSYLGCISARLNSAMFYVTVVSLNALNEKKKFLFDFASISVFIS